MKLTKEQLLKLKTDQLKLEALRGLLETLKDAFNLENQQLMKNIILLENQVTDYKFELKDVAKSEYQETQNKKLLGGIGIRVGTELEYLYENAYKWANEHRLCLTLDVKGFEALAKTQPLDFVKKTEKITVTFPKEIIL